MKVFGETDTLCRIYKLSEPYFFLPLVDVPAWTPSIPLVHCQE